MPNVVDGAIGPVAAGPVTPGEFAALMMAALGPFPPHPRMVAGVSGGPHSLALFLLLRGWGADVRPVVVDHGLRAESASEAHHVAAMLAAQGTAPRVVRLNLASGTAVQERARHGRMAALAAVAAEEGRPWIALGHHASDQAETVLLRLHAKSGPAGLAGMAPGRAVRDALLIRPLLGVPPARLEAVVAQAGWVAVRDPSNLDLKFARIRARFALTSRISAGLLRHARDFARRRATMELAVARRAAEAATILPEGFARLSLLRLGHDAVAGAVLAGLVRMLGGAAYAPAPEATHALLARGFGSLGGTVLGRDGVLMREATAMAPPVPAEAGAVWDGRWRLDSTLQGCTLGSLGTALRPRHLPARVAASLPALWREETLVAAPTLGYAAEPGMDRCRVVFEPSSGPLV